MALPLAGQVDDADSVMDVVDLLALRSFVVGQEPYARETRLERVRSDARLLPDQGELVREAVEDQGRSRLVVGEGWTVRSVHWTQTRRATVTVTAINQDLAETVLKQTIAGAVEEPPATNDTVPVGFWHLTSRGPRRVSRDIDAEPWSVLRVNYPARALPSLDALMELTPQTVPGRLMLFHGPPGTGKTTMLRSLARQWRAWCQLDCLLDPERLFADPAYLMDVALGDDSDDEPRWRLLLLEDCDELIRGEAAAAAGQALSRLLNLTDGLLGQGRNVLVAITTNENLARFHPAVIRPGRCLAHIELGRLPFPEAVAWLGRTVGIGPEGATLAELYALRAGASPMTLTEPELRDGCYL